MRSIVVGVDGRERSSRALAFGVGLARREHATLNVCYVAPGARWGSLALSSLVFLPGVPSAPYVSGAPWNVLAEAESADVLVAQAVSDEAYELLASSGISGQVFIRTGNIVGELARLAEEQHADVIIVGAPRRFRLRSVFVTRRLTHGYRHGLLIAA